MAAAEFNGDVVVDGVVSGNNSIGGNAASLKGYTTGSDEGVMALKYDAKNFGNSSKAIQVWNSSTGVFKTFVVDHPLDQKRYMVHATLEGPEGAVFYRGTAQLKGGRAEVSLPKYFEEFTRKSGRTVILTNVDGFDQLAVKTVKGEKIHQGTFVVYSNQPDSTQQFDWEVKAIRADGPPLEVEPEKEKMQVGGFGPYRFEILKKD